MRKTTERPTHRGEEENEGVGEGLVCGFQGKILGVDAAPDDEEAEELGHEPRYVAHVYDRHVDRRVWQAKLKHHRPELCTQTARSDRERHVRGSTFWRVSVLPC